MADHTVTLTAAQEAGMEKIEGETADEYCQRAVVDKINISIRQQRQHDFDTLTDEKKDLAITAGKA
jgi:hypothetical protein